MTEGRKIEIPQADTVIGLPKNWEENLDVVEEKFREAYRLEGVKKIEGLELEKGERELEIIRFVNESVSKYLQQYGRNIRFDTPLDKIHILTEGGTEQFTKGKFRTGAHSTRYGSVLVDRTISDIQFALVLFHEQLHNGSYKALQGVAEDQKLEIKNYRTGISVYSRDGQKIYLENFEEAVIRLLTERFFNEEIFLNPMFQENIENLKYGRDSELEGLERIVTDLLEKNSKDFASKEEIESIFIKAQITGRLLPLTRLIEKTYGKGSFRRIAEKSAHSTASKKVKE